MEDVFAIVAIFVGLPWLIMHYVTKWKTAGSLTSSDEDMLDEMYDLARRLTERVETMERMVRLDNPEWRPAIGQDDSHVERILQDDYAEQERNFVRAKDRMLDRRN